MMNELFVFLLKLALISLTIERAFNVIFNISFIKEIVNAEGKWFPRTDFKTAIVLVVSVFIAQGLDYRILALISSAKDVNTFTLWADYIMTGAVISGGSDVVNNYIREIAAKRKLVEEALKEKQNGNDKQQ